jgi:hypothetical protein
MERHGKMRNTFIITGQAGSGKSFFIANYLSKLPGTKFMATTGAAAARLQEIKIPATTLHSFLSIREKDKKLFQTLNEREPKNKRLRVRNLIIDEASMLDMADFEAFKNYYPLANIFLVGDWTQLSPVGGTLIKEYQVDHVLEITDNWRCTDTRLLKLMDAIKKGDSNYVNAIIKSKTTQKFNSINLTYRNFNKQIIGNLLHPIIKTGDFLIFKPHYIDFSGSKRTDHHFEELGRICRFINNVAYEVIEMNENQTRVRNIYNNDILFVADDEIPFFNVSESITIHCCQGLTFNDKYTIDLNGAEKATELNRLLHVAVSRAKNLDQFSFLSDPDKNPIEIKIEPLQPLSSQFSGSQEEVWLKIKDFLFNQTSPERAEKETCTIKSPINRELNSTSLRTNEEAIKILGIKRTSYYNYKKAGLSLEDMADLANSGLTLRTWRTKKAKNEIEELKNAKKKISAVKNKEEYLNLIYIAPDGGIEISSVTKRKAEELIQKPFIGPIENTNNPKYKIVNDEGLYYIYGEL